ncbi:MAG: N-acetyltransferase [Roseiflexaceae bacterium]|nr:N-acetyltransferase [Roseiflexaceae bacterium]
MAIISRQYANEQDYESMRVLLRTCYARNPLVYCTIGDLDWWRSAESNPDSFAAQLWLEGRQVVAFAWPSPNQIDIICHPDLRDLEEEILAWGEQWGRSTAPPDQQPLTFSSWAFTGDARRAALYERQGYTRTSVALNYRTRPLTQPFPELTLAQGYRIRNVYGPEEASARVAVHRDAFAPSRMTLDYYQAALRMPTYRRKLDLVVEAPDQSLAAFCIVWYDEVNRMGVFEPVGCHSAHRRRGLTSTLIVEGLHRLRQLGAYTTHVTSVAGIVPAEALYELLGFTITDRNERWQKTLS